MTKKNLYLAIVCLILIVFVAGCVEDSFSGVFVPPIEISRGCPVFEHKNVTFRVDQAQGGYEIDDIPFVMNENTTSLGERIDYQLDYEHNVDDNCRNGNREGENVNYIYCFRNENVGILILDERIDSTGAIIYKKYYFYQKLVFAPNAEDTYSLVDFRCTVRDSSIRKLKMM